MPPSDPLTRGQIEIAIICALPREHDAVYLMFDTIWADLENPLGRAINDSNHYLAGTIGAHNVVLVLLSNVGKINAANAAASIPLSFSSLKLVLLVGICGGVPTYRTASSQPGYEANQSIFLGDVVLSENVVQYDLGKRYPDKFIRKNTAQDNLRGPNRDISNLLATFQSQYIAERLQQRTVHFLGQLLSKASRKVIIISTTREIFNAFAEIKRPIQSAPKHGFSSCSTLGCDFSQTIHRRPDIIEQIMDGTKRDTEEPNIHIGAIASGDSVMRCAIERDYIAAQEGVIAFEMEGAGVWSTVPCMIIKGISDYSDSHKDDTWQDYAAATAAAAMKAVLERYATTDVSAGASAEGYPRNQPTTGSNTQKSSSTTESSRSQSRNIVASRRKDDAKFEIAVAKNKASSTVSQAEYKGFSSTRDLMSRLPLSKEHDLI